MGFVCALFQERNGQLRLGVCRQNFFNFTRGDLLGRSVCAHVNRRRFVATTAQERDVFHEDAVGVRAYCPLLDLRASNTLERKACGAYVVKNFDRVSVQRIDLIAQLQQCIYRIRIGFR